MPGNSEGACQAGMVPSESQLAGYLGARPCPVPQLCHPQSRGEAAETKEGAEKCSKRGSCTRSPVSDLMGMH